MNAAIAELNFASANPHALATILAASETKRIIASRDIFDLSGTKLWARNQPVSQALQRKLLDRQLRQPLETCLLAEDGVTTHSLVQAVEALLALDTPLTALLRPNSEKVVREVAHLPLHSVAQLLLTAAQASRPQAFAHAIEAMVLAGILMAAQGGSTQELRLAMLGGLLHDLGEIYVDPQFGEADADSDMEFHSYQQLVVHPHVGQLLLTQLTDYPAVLARAVGEHHERLDGSGYPHALQRDQVSPLGRLLCVTEATLATLRAPQAHLSLASVALRAVPGEFDLRWVGLVASAARAQPKMLPRLKADAIQVRLSRLDAAMQAAQRDADTLLTGTEPEALKDALKLAQYLIGRLRAGWNASGLWCREDVATQDAAEVEAVERELLFRLRAVQRAVLLRAGDLPPGATQRLQRYCDILMDSVG